jgi:hypothetical protein
MKVRIVDYRTMKPARSINCRGERWEVKWITFPASAHLHSPGWTNYKLLGTTPEGWAMDRGAYWSLLYLWDAELPAGMYKQKFEPGAIEDWCGINNITIIKSEVGFRV